MTTSDNSTGIFTTDRNLVVRSWDHWMVAATGIAATDACGRELSELFPELEARRLLQRFQNVLEFGVVEVLAPAFHQYLIPCPPGAPSKHFQRMQQRATIAPLRGEDGVVGALVTIEDVTARLELEREAAEKLKNGNEADRLHAAEMLSADGSLTPVTPLVSALSDDSWRVRRAAVDGLAAHGGPEATTALLRALREEHHDPSVLNSALQVLTMIDLDTVTPLIEFLQDPDHDLRIYAATALGEMRDRRAVSALLKAVHDPDANVRYHAIEALGKLRAPEAVDALCEVLAERDFFLAFPALDALKLIGDNRAAPSVLPLLTDDKLQEAACETLGRIGGDEAVAPLAQLLNEGHVAVTAIARSLADIFDRYEKLYGEGQHVADLARRVVRRAGVQHLIDGLHEIDIDANKEALRAVALVLGWLEGAAVERALTLLLGKPTARKEVVEAVVRCGSRVVQLLIEQLSADDLETRKAAIIALGRIGDGQAVAPLIGLLDQDDELTVLAAGALAKIGDRRSFEPLLELLAHRNITVRQAAVAALNSLGHPDMPQRMMQYLVDPRPAARESAVKIAGYFGYSQCANLLFERCEDEDEAVRCAAVENIAYLEDDRVAAALTRAAQGESARVRAAAARAFGFLDGAEGLPALRRMLKDADHWVRYFALRSMNRISYLQPGKGESPGRNGTLEQLSELARSDPATFVRIAAVETLGHMGGVYAAPILTSLSEESEKDLAQAALKALGMIDHPDALRVLLAAARSPDAEKRKAAIFSFQERRTPDTVAALQGLVSREADGRVAAAAVDVLAHLATSEAIGALLALAADDRHRDACMEALARVPEHGIQDVATGLTSPVAAVRAAVVQALARMKNPAATERLMTALDDVDPSVRLQAVAALKILGARRAEGRLRELARTDPDPSVRRLAELAVSKWLAASAGNIS